MFVYAPASSPTYSSPTLYPVSHYDVAPPVLTARERYLRAMAEERAARARYISELEEQRILASLRQQEALRQAEFRQHQIAAAQHAIARRRVGRIYAENLYRPVVSPQGRRQVFVRQHGGLCFPMQRSPSPLDDVDAIVSAFLQDGADEYISQRQQERARAEQGSNADIFNARARLARSLERALEATQGNRDKHASQPLGEATAATLLDLSRVPLSCQSEMPRSLARDHAARAIQQRWRSRSANAVARNDAVATIATLRSRFQFLNDTFSFPERLEFKGSVAGQGQEAPPLLFTPANAAVHAYTHELTKLLNLADAVSSHGSDQIREARRSFVRLVEAALDNVDRRVAKVWGKRSEDATATITHSRMAAHETSTTVPVNVTHPTNDAVVHIPEPDKSLPDSTAADSEPLASDCESDVSTNADTVIPYTITNPITNTFDNSPTPQDGPSVQGASPPMPEEAIHIPRNTKSADSVREDHDVFVPVQYRNVNPEEALAEDLNSADTSLPNSPLSQSRETSQVSTVGSMEVTADDAILACEGVTVTSALDSTRSEPFDVVYPDSPPLPSIAVEGSLNVGREQGPSVLAAEGVMPGTGNEAQSNLTVDVEDQEGFELL